MIKRAVLIVAMTIVGTCGMLSQGFAQAYSGDNYKKALWMSTRFYGGQRSGAGPNWLIMEHENPNYRDSYTLDNDNGRDISGGWFDCGDHILFGQTFFFSAYVLALAYESFPTGFHDLYHWDYSDYMAATGSDEVRWSMASGQPNGTPDLLEELKYATDWIMKAVPDANTFIYQVGDHRHHHEPWATSGFQSFNLRPHPNWNGGNPRPVYKNPNDKPMPSLAAAALAVMSRISRKYYGDAYADSLLQHARYAYDYASRQSGSVGGTNESGGQANYPPHKHPATVFITAAAEMYLATGEQTYLNAINRNDMEDHGHIFDYSNSHDLAAYAAARAAEKAGNTEDRDYYLGFLRETFLKQYTERVGGSAETGIVNLGGGWGEMRYLANAAFIAALYQLATGTTEYDNFIHRQIDFILGDNNSNISFLVGFDERPTGSNATIRSVIYPHHRNVFLRDFNDWNVYNSEKSSMRIPPRNKYFGYLAGGRRNSSQFDVNNTSDYTATEGGVDYQAGFVGALGYIVSNKAPADTASFGKPPSSIRSPSRASGRPASGYAMVVRPNAVTFTAQDGLTINKINIYNMQGRRVWDRSGSYRSVNWQNAGRARGMYLVDVSLSDGSVVRRNLLLK